MAKIVVQEPPARRLDKRWIGKVLIATQDSTVPVLNGSGVPVAEVLEGQRLRVVGIDPGGWLRCRYLDDVFLRGPDKRKVLARVLEVGIHVEHDLGKFRIQRGRVEQAGWTPDQSGEMPDTYFAARHGLWPLRQWEAQTARCMDCDEQVHKLYFMKADVAWVACLSCWRRSLTDTQVVVSDVITEQVDPRAWVAIVREWVEVKSTLHQLGTALAQLSGSSQELAGKLQPVIAELNTQRQRIDNVVLRFQRVTDIEGSTWYPEALADLEGVVRLLAAKAERFIDEVVERENWSKMEQDKLVQAFTWVTSLMRRVWGWLRKTQKAITRLEQLVFFS